MLTVPLADSTFKELRDFIYEKCGIYIADTKKYLIENRLSRILQEKNLTAFEDYLKIIKFSVNGSELSRLFDAVTTNETYFYREPDQLNIFVNSIFENIRTQKSASAPVKIWSAACSSGEEPYTLSIMLSEKGYRQGKFDLYGSDISDAVLQSAKTAIYNSYSVRNVPPQQISKYFMSNGQSYSLNPSIKDSVKFMKINLFDEKNIRTMRNTDIIFCRNVLIYFDVKSKQKVASHLYDCLNPGGYLFIGASESLHNITRAFRPIIFNKVIAYQKV